MDDNLYQDDFEEFLQDQVGNQRMYPSDAVWRNINKELHGDNQWPALTVSAFALLIATLAVCIHFSPKPNIFAIPPAYAQVNGANAKSTQITGLAAPSFFPTNKSTLATNSTSSTNVAVIKDIKELAANREQADRKDKKASGGSLAKVIPLAIVENASKEFYNSSTPTVEPEKISSLISAEPAAQIPLISSKNIDVVVKPASPDFNEKNMADDFLQEHKNDLALYTTTHAKSLKNKFSYVVYVAPSVSYRKLDENRFGLQDTSTGGPLALNYVTDVNKVVRHKPGTGIEAGIGVIYNVSDKFRVRSGLQFNIRQYNIEAYRSSIEPTSIALVSGGVIDTINTFSVYRTNNGYVSAELVNRYYQIAVPLGIEWEIIGNKNIQLNVAGSIQPTYLLNKNAYLISTNYKNYTESRGMVNSWNLNSNIEAFISFKVGDFKWQVGPQLRYQHLSTFISAYPIKEHLMDYGFKLGVSKVIL